MRDDDAWSPPNGDTVELVAAGRAWDAVRVPSRIGLSALARLGDDSGPVIQDTFRGLLCWLVRPGAAADWEPARPFVEVRGESSYVAVPPVWRTEEHHRLRWVLQPTRTRYLTDPELLHAALTAEIDAVIGLRPVLLPCEPCLGGKIFGGRHHCKGTSSMGLVGRRMTPAPEGACPCDHKPPRP
jgi:hypothetical protein